jgi:hypothetical protein
MGWRCARLAVVLVAMAALGNAVPSLATGATARALHALPGLVPCDTHLGTCWAPAIGTDWQWQLQCDTAPTCANLAIKVPFYDIDWEDNPASTVASIHTAGRHAYCYIDIGTWERFRSDASQFPSRVLGRNNGWPGERWLDIRKLNVLGPIMTARMDTCSQKGFDGVQFDNVDGWQSTTGFPLTQHDDAYYTAWMANEAHRRGLATSWENAIENSAALQPYMDALVLEQCYQYSECDQAHAMTDAGKWVGGVEYRKAYADMRFCLTYQAQRIVGMFKKLSLKSWRVACS